MEGTSSFSSCSQLNASHLVVTLTSHADLSSPVIPTSSVAVYLERNVS